MKIDLDKKSREQILNVRDENKIFLEGNILRLIDFSDDPEFEEYIRQAVENDKENRRKRLEVTKKIQSQNKELVEQRDQNEKLMVELTEALKKAEDAKKTVEEDLDILQKKIQTELIGTIVKVALWIIIGVGITTSILFSFAFFLGKDTTLLGNVWSSMFGILLTNAFSIIGTIMGVKYASENHTKR
jgi:hypothetical protein